MHSYCYNSKMEIPPEIALLYRHLERHSSHPVKNIKELDCTRHDSELLYSISIFISERMNVWKKKYNNESKPYTTDPVLVSYRFCNIYRELDKQTIQLHTFLNPLRDDLPLWILNMFAHRIIANPETSYKLGYLSLDTEQNRELMDLFLEIPRPKFGSPYIFPISVIQAKNISSRESFICEVLPMLAPFIAFIVSSSNNESITHLLTEICESIGLNLRFHITELLIDTAYQFPECIDLYKPIYIGPGAMPTARLFEAPDILEQLTGYTPESFPVLTLNTRPIPLSYENWEGIFCEFRKYSNLLKGIGRKRKY